MIVEVILNYKEIAFLKALKNKTHPKAVFNYGRNQTKG